MKIDNITLISITADEGKILIDRDHTSTSKKIFLGVHDSVENYYEVTEEEGLKTLKEKENDANDIEAGSNPD